MSVRILATRGTESQIQSASSASQSEGQIAYATDTKEFYVSDGTQFNKIGKDQLSQFSEISVVSNIDTWHLSDTNRLDLNPPESNPTGITFKPDGTKAFVLGYSLNRVQMYDLSTAWDLTTAGSPTQSEYLVQNNLGGTQEDFFIDSSGTRMYVLSRSSDSVGQFTLNTAWDISDITFVQDVHMNSTSLSGGVAGFVTGEDNPMGITFKPDGTIMYITGYTTDDVFQIPLSTAWDISTHGTITSVDVSIEGTPNAVQFNNDGTVMYIMGYSTDAILQYNLSTAWDVTTASFVKRTTPFIRILDGTGTGFYYNETEQKAFVCGRASDFAYEVIISEAIRFSDPVSAEVLQGDKVIANELITGYTGRNDFFNSTYTHSHFQTYSNAYLGYNSGAQNVRVGNTVYGNYRFHVFQGNYIDAGFISNPTGALPNIRFFNPYIGGVGVFSIGKTHNTSTTYLLGGVTDIESEADTFDHKGEITLGGELKVTGNQPLKYKDPNLYTQGTQIVLDNFTEASDTDLLNHTPDTGSGYTQVFITSGTSSNLDYAKISGGNGYVSPARNNSNDGFRFTNDTTISTANYEARAVIKRQSTSDDPFVLVVKYIDEDNYFAMHFAGNYNYCTPISVVNGVYTQHGALYYYANTSSADNINIEVALRVVGNNVHLFYEGRYRGSREVNITGAGKAGIGFGKSQNSLLTSYDLSTNAQISKFEVYELPDSLFDGSDSVHYIENGKLGIGTTTPAYNLDISGSSTTVVNVQGEGGTGTETKLYLFNKSDGAGHTGGIASLRSYGWGNAELRLGSNYFRQHFGNLDINTSGQDVVFSNVGNVGIGTTSPYAKLHISGSTGAESAIRQSRVGVKIWDSQIDSSGRLIWSHYAAEGGGANQLFTLDDADRVGIGTTSPAYKLDVSGDINIPLGGNYLRFGGELGIKKVSNGAMHLYAGANSTTGGFDFATWNGSSYNEGSFVIRNNGRVGIGTTSPSRSLHVLTTGWNGILSESSTTNGAIIRIKNTQREFELSSRSDSFQIRDITDSDTNRFIINSSGNVGIGTTSPSTKFHVDGNIRVGDANDVIYTNKLHGLSIGDLTLYTSGNTLLTQTGNVGIGNTNPTHTVEIGTDGGGEKILKMHSDTANSYFEIQSLGNVARLLATNNTNLLLQSDGTGGYITFNANSAERMRILYNGNVGIGTTSPDHLLHVSGNAKMSNIYLLGNIIHEGDVDTQIKFATDTITFDTAGSERLTINSTGNVDLTGNLTVTKSSATIKAIETGGGDVRMTAGGATGYIGTYNNNSLQLVQNGNVALFVDTSRNVGIGTTSPSSPLTVAGRVDFQNDLRLRGTDSAANQGVARFYVDSNNKLHIDTANDGSNLFAIDSAGAVKIGSNNHQLTLEQAGGTLVGRLSYTGTILRIQGNGGIRFEDTNGSTIHGIITDSGNYGIGTTSPEATALLDVSSTTKGVLFPRMTSAQRTAISSPATGLIVYQTDSTEGLYIYKSTGWIQII